ncbi:MAG: penicillin acylase family protein [Pseudomonadota bacterium]
MQKRGFVRWTVRILLGLIGLVLLLALAIWMYLRASLPKLDGSVSVAGLGANVSVARDARGVPLISGVNRNDIAYATGYVHAQDRFFQMDLLRRVGAGELSELFGAMALQTDRNNRLHRFRTRAQQALQAMSAEDRAFLDRYVTGVNDGLNALTAKPFEYTLMQANPRLWTAADSLLVVYAMYFDLQGGLQSRELARGWLAETTTPEQRAFLLPEATSWDAPIDADSISTPLAPIPDKAPEWWGKPRMPDAVKVAAAAANFVDHVGSNNWAVAGSRSKDGVAIVADDMHLNVSLPNTWYRLAFEFREGQGVRKVAGLTLPGAPPVVVVGSNGRVAWGYTNSYGDYLDLVTLEVDPAKPGQVRTPKGWETPVTITETIVIKGAAAEKMGIRESSLGPLRELGGKTYAVRWLAHQAGALNLNAKRLETADSVAAALDIAPTMGIPSQNFVAGDAQGNIGWTIAGLLPFRSQQGVLTTYPMPLDGSVLSFDSALPPADYPRVLNPESGIITTANSRQLAGPGAALIGDGGFDIGARNRQARDGLLALGPKTDVTSVYGVALDDRALFVAPWRERAIKVLDAAALQGKPLRAEFLEHLDKGWSGRASIDSVGYRLARQFMWAMYEELYDGANGQLFQLDERASMSTASSRWYAVVARLLDEKPAGWLPAQHASWEALQLAAVDRAIKQLTDNGKPLSSATWGARNTASIAHPISSASPMLKRWLSAPADKLPGDAHMPRVAGAKFGQSQRMTVSPGKEDQGVFNMPGGQSGHPMSPYFLNGHAEWVSGKPLPFLPGHAVHTLTFVK